MPEPVMDDGGDEDVMQVEPSIAQQVEALEDLRASGRIDGDLYYQARAQIVRHHRDRRRSLMSDVDPTEARRATLEFPQLA